jgi:hypothetical protein
MKKKRKAFLVEVICRLSLVVRAFFPSSDYQRIRSVEGFLVHLPQGAFENWPAAALAEPPSQ